MAQQPFISRRERFAVVGSTNDVVREWLAAGTPEVCLAIAGEQSAGRGREGRTWVAPPGAALLMSIGFRPTWLPPERAWRLAATASLAMAEAAEAMIGLLGGTVRLKWPNDLVLDAADVGGAGVGGAGVGRPGVGGWRKLGGVLGESDGLGTSDPRVVIGMGINADWSEADFPADLADDMTSLRVASGDGAVDALALVEAFVGFLEDRVMSLRRGSFDAAAWHARQATTGRTIRLELPDGTADVVRALAVDSETGALIVQGDPDEPERQVLSAEVRHLRLGTTAGMV
ncbi:MAG: biotin--[acetyl-CoA-carboxylase] ligase [Chloroflexota bacterium]|nr:biotin--[acetyl-CoA-carboxylase] ligase [Chloroflexota bacterium]